MFVLLFENPVMWLAYVKKSS
jgi:hypothetical protein